MKPEKQRQTGEIRVIRNVGSDTVAPKSKTSFPSDLRARSRALGCPSVKWKQLTVP